VGARGRGGRIQPPQRGVMKKRNADSRTIPD